MNNDPISILGVHPSGGITKSEDPRDFPWHPDEITQAAAPFIWEQVTDPDVYLAEKLWDSKFRLPRKNQGTSGSCGGQAMSYEGQQTKQSNDVWWIKWLVMGTTAGIGVLALKALGA